MDRAVMLWVLSVAAAALAFFLPFVSMRLRPVTLKPWTTPILAFVAAIIILYAVWKAADLDGDSVALLFALGFLPLGVAAGARAGWRFVAPVGGALGLVVLAGIAWGPLQLHVAITPKFPSPPSITPLTWAMMLVGTLALFVPRRWASAPAAASLWLALVTAALHAQFLETELQRVYYMAGPSFIALAALLSATVPTRGERVPRCQAIGSQR